MAYNIDASSDSCCPGTSVLVNKLGLEEQALPERVSRWRSGCLAGFRRWIFFKACLVGT